MHFGLGLDLTSYSTYPMYIGAIVAFLLSVFWRPEIGLYYLVPTLPMQTLRLRLHQMPMGEKFIDFLLLGTIIGALVRSANWKTPLNRLLLITGIVYFISLFRGSFYIGAPLPIWITDPRFSDWKNYMVLPVLFLTVAAVIKDVTKMKILIVLMVLSTLLVNRSFYSTTSGRDYTHFSYEVRDAGPLGYAGENGFAAFEAQMGIFLIALYTCQRRVLVKAAIVGALVTIIYCLFFSFSRGGYFGFLVGILFLGIVKDRKLLVLLVCFLFFWQVLTPVAVQERVLMTHQEGQLDASAGDRVRIWEDALSILNQDIFLGKGFITYKYMHRVAQYEDTHNLYLKFLVETGIVGLSLLLWLWAKAYRMSFRLFRISDDPFVSSIGLGLAAWTVAAVVLNLFGDRWTYIEVTGFFWTLLAFVVRGLKLGEHELPQEGPEVEVEAEVVPAETPDVFVPSLSHAGGALP